MSISVDLGNVSVIPNSGITWMVGFVRDPVINYTTATGEVQFRSPYFRTRYPSDIDAVSAYRVLRKTLLTVVEQIAAFLADYESASARATDLDNTILSDAAAISPQYADLVSLAIRQAFGGIDISVASDTNGNWNMSDVKVFMKDIGTSR